MPGPASVAEGVFGGFGGVNSGNPGWIVGKGSIQGESSRSCGAYSLGFLFLRHQRSRGFRGVAEKINSLASSGRRDHHPRLSDLFKGENGGPFSFRPPLLSATRNRLFNG
jgi:hypothetical protein